MSAHRRIGSRSSAVIALLFALGASGSHAADLGPHGNLSADSGGCTACHLSPAPRGLDIGRLRGIAVPRGGKARLADPMARLCWICHRAGNPYGARPLDGRALDAPGHGAVPGTATASDARLTGRPVVDPFTPGRSRTSKRGRIGCTTCHDVHDGAAPLFLRRGTNATGDAGQCAACHPGRENAARTGRRNIVIRDGSPYSTHPARRSGAAPAAGGETPRCNDCHDVHRAPAPGQSPVPGLLTGAPGETTADLCRRCHDLSAPGGREAHALAGARQCVSCHDLHGGLPLTSLLRGPDTPGAAGSGAPPIPALDADAVSGLVEALRDRDPAAREQAYGVLTMLRPALDPAALRPAAADERPQVRAHAAGVIGALGDRRGGDMLLALAADADAQVRAAAAPALVAAAEPRAATALLPLLADPDTVVRRAAVTASAKLRDPRTIPGLVALLEDPDWDLVIAAEAALAGFDDARALHAVLAERPSPATPGHLIAVLDGLSDPAALDDILGLLAHGYRTVREAAARALARYPRPGVAEALAGLLRDAAGFTAATSLVELGDPRAASLLAAVLADPEAHPALRRAMAKNLGRIAAPPVVEPLIAALADTDAGVREEANVALAALTCRNFGADQARWRAWWGAQPPAFPLGRCE